MAEATVLICDGCEKATTSRRPVINFHLVDNSGDNPVSVIEGDAHDWNCFGRIISRKRKGLREAAAAEKKAAPKAAKK